MATVKTTKNELLELVRRQDSGLAFLSERLYELEIQQENDGWLRIASDSGREFSRDGLRKIVETARLSYLKNPLIRRGVDVQAHYVFALGMNISATKPEANVVVQKFLSSAGNRLALTGQVARLNCEKTLRVDGNLFVALFVDRMNTGTVSTRLVPFEEIEEIITDPQDSQTPWFYKRTWSQKSLGSSTPVRKTAYYPDWRYAPESRATGIGNTPVYWDVPICHLRCGGLSGMRFGVPEVYPALDWARAVVKDLEAYATVKQSLSRFAWELHTRGGAGGVSAARARLNSTFARPPGAPEGNPPPVPGSTFIGAEGVQLNPIKTADSQPSPEEGRRLWLMVCSALGIPETFFGDTSTGNLATAVSLDRPTELKMRERQQLWREFYLDLLDFVLREAAQAPNGPLTDTAEPDPVHVDFPPLLERDVTTTINAIVQAATLGGRTAAGTMDDRTLVRLILTSLGIDNIGILLDAIAPENGESLLATRERERQAAAAAPSPGRPAERRGPGELKNAVEE